MHLGNLLQANLGFWGAAIAISAIGASALVVATDGWLVRAGVVAGHFAQVHGKRLGALACTTFLGATQDTAQQWCSRRPLQAAAATAGRAAWLGAALPHRGRRWATGVRRRPGQIRAGAPC